ncbi:MAG: MurR/RpiR family transcriptional regulator [Selenomonadaceae bacterium]|nr:MurR/RpiR family transcriptional regulator [Selenomonadaceae bacterium]
MSSLLKKLQNKKFLSHTEVVIADYLIENYRDLPNLSTRELAKRTFTSSATIVRFCQKFDFEGYSEFKTKFFAEMLKHGNEVQPQLISEQDNINEIMDKVRKIKINAINDAYNLLNPALLSRVLKLFQDSLYIDFYTLDEYIYLANRISDLLTLAEKFPSVHASMPLQYLQAYETPKKHLGFFICPNGENRLLVDIAKLLKRQSVPTILITSENNSTLANIVDEHFTVNIGETFEELGNSIFFSGANYIANTLVATLIAQTNYKTVNEKKIWLKKNVRY